MATIIWLLVATFLLIALIVRIFQENKTHRHIVRSHRRRLSVPLIEVGRETDEFFAPGDNDKGSKYDYYD